MKFSNILQSYQEVKVFVPPFICSIFGYSKASPGTRITPVTFQILNYKSSTNISGNKAQNVSFIGNIENNFQALSTIRVSPVVHD